MASLKMFFFHARVKNHFIKRDWKRNFKWPSICRVPCPIYNDTLYTFVWSRNSYSYLYRGKLSAKKVRECTLARRVQCTLARRVQCTLARRVQCTLARRERCTQYPRVSRHLIFSSSYKRGYLPPFSESDLYLSKWKIIINFAYRPFKVLK